MVKYEALLALIAASVAESAAAPTPAPKFNWEAITPAKDIEYHDCYDGFQCARLILPLDWKNETKPETVSIAMIKLPAVVSQDDPAYGGPIFTNPGGPGGSGVGHLLAAGHRLREVLDTPGKKHFDMVSFDPRGIANSFPAVDCYSKNALARDAAAMEMSTNGALDISPVALPYALSLFHREGKRCVAALENVLPYINTPSTARDMVAMVDKIDELKKRKQGENRLELRSTEDDLPRLQYIGFSYGTILGNYFATLFPGRVGRVILDGVCNTNDYANGPGWLTNTVDTDEMTHLLFKGCFKAGGDKCKLRHHKDKSAHEMTSRFWKWVDTLDQNPLLATTSDHEARTIIIRSGGIRELIFGTLYHADKGFMSLASDLADALNGNTTALANRHVREGGVPTIENSCAVNATYGSEMTQAPQAVLCGDGEDITSKDLKWWRHYMKDQIKQSSVAGGIWTAIRLACSGWNIKPNWVFRGPFTTPKASKTPEKGRPAAPLLFMSNRFDPVTPLRAARAMAKNHPDARVLVQESKGHCVLGGVASECTRKVLREYLDKGVLPSEETVCEGVLDPWNPSTLTSQTLDAAHQLMEIHTKRRTRSNVLGL